MKKCIIIFLLFVVSLVLFSCKSNKTMTQERETMSQENVNQSKQEYKYSMYLSDDCLWDSKDPFEPDYVKEGKITYESDLLTELNNAKHNKLYAIRFEFISVSDIEEIKEVCKYLSEELKFKNNFNNMEDKELYNKIDDQGTREFLFFITKEQLYSIEWPNDIEVVIFWENKSLELEVDKESLEFYVNEYDDRKLTVRYYNVHTKDSGNRGCTEEEVLDMLNKGYEIYWDWEMMDNYFSSFE